MPMHEVAGHEPGPLLLPELRVPLPSPDAVSLEADRVYRTIDSVDLRFDRYRPLAGQALGTVLLVHGEPVDAGRFWGPSRTVRACGPLRSWGRLLASRGLEAIAFDHRTSDNFADPAAVVSDIEAMLAACGTPASRVALFAFSGGVPFAQHVAREHGVRALVTAYGPLDLRDSGVRAAFPGISSDHAARYSAILAADDPRWPAHLHLWPEHDWLPNAATQFEATRDDDRFELRWHPTGGHGFDFTDDDDATRDLIDQTVEFLVRAFD